MNLNFDGQDLKRVFWETDDYRDFLAKLCEKKLSSRLPSKAKLAQVLQVSPSFVSKILGKKGHLTFEQAEKLAKVLDFSTPETLALFDKITLAKTASKSLKESVRRRLKTSFDQAYHSPAPALANTDRVPAPANLLFFKLAECLHHGNGLTIDEIASQLKTSRDRVRFLLEKMAPYFHFVKMNSPKGPLYKLDLSSAQYRPREPGSQALYDLGMSLRRWATYSLESRYPIHLVDDSEHYVSGSYVLPLNAAQIQSTSAFFAQLTKQITDSTKNARPSTETKWVGICFDVFDVGGRI